VTRFASSHIALAAIAMACFACGCDGVTAAQADEIATRHQLEVVSFDVQTPAALLHGRVLEPALPLLSGVLRGAPGVPRRVARL
jgi:predicted nucleotide-binding protein (sugar kinase/HSP70/actin superfamily)